MRREAGRTRDWRRTSCRRGAANLPMPQSCICPGATSRVKYGVLRDSRERARVNSMVSPENLVDVPGRAVRKHSGAKIARVAAAKKLVLC